MKCNCRIANLTLKEKRNVVWSGHAAVANIEVIPFFCRAKGKEETKADLTFSDVFRDDSPRVHHDHDSQRQTERQTDRTSYAVWWVRVNPPHPLGALRLLLQKRGLPERLMSLFRLSVRRNRGKYGRIPLR